MKSNKLEKAFLEITKNWNDNEVKSAWENLQEKIKEAKDFYDWFNKKQQKLTIKLPQLLKLEKCKNDKQNWEWTHSIIDWAIDFFEAEIKNCFHISPLKDGWGKWSEQDRLQMLIDMLKHIKRQIVNGFGKNEN